MFGNTQGEKRDRKRSSRTVEQFEQYVCRAQRREELKKIVVVKVPTVKSATARALALGTRCHPLFRHLCASLLCGFIFQSLSLCVPYECVCVLCSSGGLHFNCWRRRREEDERAELVEP